MSSQKDEYEDLIGDDSSDDSSDTEPLIAAVNKVVEGEEPDKEEESPDKYVEQLTKDIKDLDLGQNLENFMKLLDDEDPTRTKESNYTLPYTLEELGLVFDDSDDVVGAIEHLEKDILVKFVSEIGTVKDNIISEVRSEFVALHTDIKIDSLRSIFKIKGNLTYEMYIKLVKSIVKKSGLFYQIYAGTEEQKSQLRDTILIHFSTVFGIANIESSFIT